jgi:hypothetical protein
MLSMKMTAPNDSAVEKVDVGALIHREFQLRKAEAAAAAAAESKKTSTASILDSSSNLNLNSGDFGS